MATGQYMPIAMRCVFKKGKGFKRTALLRLSARQVDQRDPTFTLRCIGTAQLLIPNRYWARVMGLIIITDMIMINQLTLNPAGFSTSTTLWLKTLVFGADRVIGRFV